MEVGSVIEVKVRQDDPAYEAERTHRLLEPGKHSRPAVQEDALGSLCPFATLATLHPLVELDPVTRSCPTGRGKGRILAKHRELHVESPLG